MGPIRFFEFRTWRRQKYSRNMSLPRINWSMPPRTILNEPLRRVRRVTDWTTFKWIPILTERNSHRGSPCDWSLAFVQINDPSLWLSVSLLRSCSVSVLTIISRSKYSSLKLRDSAYSSRMMLSLLRTHSLCDTFDINLLRSHYH